MQLSVAPVLDPVTRGHVPACRIGRRDWFLILAMLVVVCGPVPAWTVEPVAVPSEISHSRKRVPLTAGQMRALALLSKVRPETPVPLFLITDPNKDPDDLSVLVISKYLHEHGFIDLRCVVTTLGNRETRRRRARFVKSVLNDLGLLETRVGVGVDYAFAVRNREGNVDAAATAGRERDHAVFVETPLLREVGVEDDGQQLLQQELQRVEDRSAVLLVVAGMTDAAFLLRNQGELVRQKARQVVIMGGVETNADERGVALADRSAYNNTTDQASADETYRRVQELGVPLVILNKESTYAAAAPRNFYDGIAATGHPVGMYLNGQQRASLEHLWTGILKGNLPPRLTPAWFFQTFTDIDVNSAAGQDILAARLAHPDDFSAIWKLVSHFNLYDPLALLATVPQIDALLYRAERVPGCRGQVALIGKNSIRDVLLVKDLMSAAAIESLNLDPLLKSRSQTVPGYPPRQMVDATLADWNRPWPDYRPPAFTAEAVLNLPSQSADSREIQNVARRFLTWRGSREVPVTRDQQGFPLNPLGRTGLCGRGDWPRWGRNQYAEALFTRVHPESGRLQMLLVRPQATGPGTLPGDVVVPDEDQLHAVRRALQGAAGAELPLTEARLICANVVDDPRNTDNAWRETAIWHLHLNASVPNGEALAGQRAGRIWVWADIHLDLLRSLPQLESDSLWIALDQLQKKSPEMGRFIDDLLKAPDDANQGASLPQAK